MGWLWSSSEPPNVPPPKSSPSNTPLGPSEPPPPTFTPDPSQPPDLPPTTPQPTRNDFTNEELNAILHSLSSPPPTAPAPKYRTSLTTPLPPSPSPSPTSTPNHPTPITPRTIYPPTISCRAAFDSAFYCQSLGGQFNNLYRYGGMRSCSEHWSSFWFCMRTNRGFMGDEEREKRVREHYWRKEGKYRQGPSSEDVWALRGEMVRGEGRFEGNLEAVEAGERERAEEMRRLGRGEELGRGKGEGRGTRRSLYGD